MDGTYWKKIHIINNRYERVLASPTTTVSNAFLWSTKTAPTNFPLLISSKMKSETQTTAVSVEWLLRKPDWLGVSILDV